MLLDILAKLFLPKKLATGGPFKVGEYPFKDEIAFVVEERPPQPDYVISICNDGKDGCVQITAFDPNIGREPDHDPVTILHPGAGRTFTLHDACKLIVESIPDADH